MISNVGLQSPLFIVVTGLPGSGKTTLGRSLAQALAVPLLDKDQVLEALFDSLGVGDEDWRARMSRAADRILATVARQFAGGVIVSWWRHPRSESSSGTGTAWLATLPGKVVEVHCHCPAELAAQRFFSRRRHPGHLDEVRSRPDELARFRMAAALGALQVGPVIACNTALPHDLPSVIRALEEHAR